MTRTDKLEQESSMEAWWALQDKLPEARRAVLDVIVAAGNRGATYAEVAEKLGLKECHSRTTELRRQGLIRSNGRRKTRAGRMATVYTACKPGEKAEPVKRMIQVRLTAKQLAVTRMAFVAALEELPTWADGQRVADYWEGVSIKN